MRFLKSNELNKKKWDELSQKSTYYSKSYFLDAVAKNWGAYVDENYSKGFALVYNEFLGIKIIYPVFLGRGIEFINLSEVEINESLIQVKKEFKTTELNSEIELEGFGNTIKRKYQIYSKNHPYNTQCKRMLKKVKQLNFSIQNVSHELLFPIIYDELKEKVKELSPENYTRLKNTIVNFFQAGKLISFGIFDEQNLLEGGLFFFEGEQKITYITGACKTLSRKNGGMYLAMDYAIQFALKKEKTIDFGGSNMESIRRFYLSLGGEDQFYFSYSWDKAPFWFKILRKIKKKF